MVRHCQSDKLFFFNFTILHWEYLLCEIRKICDGNVRELYKEDSAIDEFSVGSSCCILCRNMMDPRTRNRKKA
jgi:hypothetical protein